MSFSAILGASSAIRPGVVTSSTRPSVPFDGQLIYETDTDRLAQYNGSAWVTQNGLQLISTTTIGSAVSTITVSNVFSSLYENYKILISGGLGSTELQLNMQLGSSTTQYYSSGIYTDYSTGSVGSANSSNTSSWIRVGWANTALGQVTMNMDILGPFISTVGTSATSLWSRNGNNLGMLSYYHNVATSNTGFTLTTSTGTVTGGTIRVYGYATN